MHFRNLKYRDIPQLLKYIRSAWMPEAPWADTVAGYYILSELSEASFAQTAVVDGLPAGFIIGRAFSRKKTYRLAKIKRILPGIKIFFNRKAFRLTRNWIEYYKKVRQIKSSALKKIAPSADRGEILLFMVDSKIRGKGIGQTLYAQMLDYFSKTGTTFFCLNTDDECSYSFYDKAGLRQIANETIIIPGFGQEKFNILIYAN